ncbi:Membrane protein MosC [Neorhizobium galegae bv. officinalis bv. officinalis str. HAMBI 1141]|uniref:Membrane protein MosC n=1 Tax=Neorhizobium galegae bv. officinalis bv. officinalis str. HAMBI 1141 TaxID=1028801 RepID=A0A068T6F8_NEOGA|nr:MFS transporter [Neorhizobium galegae]CDN54122.1 Membrane protein MosC [Neorhizobium galegae bv. officinalis bv. officinalis str. HAMBI 1141]
MKNLLPPALLYFSNAILFISLFTRLPAIQASLGIDKAGLGLALLSAPVGTFLALPLAGRINDRLTPRLTALVTLPICALLTPALTILPVAGFVICFFLFGFFRTIFDVAANMISAGIEQRTGRKVLSRSHGFWSVGLLAGSLCSGFLAEKAVTPFVQQTLATGFVIAACLFVFWVTPRDPAPETPPDRKGSAYVLPDRTIVLICVMVFGLCIVEGAVYDWGIFFLREQLKADPAIAGVLYAAFTVGMGLTRLSGDMLRDSFGSMILVRTSAVSVALGILLLVAMPSLTLAGAALFLIGCGVALAFPLAVSTTIALGKGRPSENLAALSLTLMLSTIGVPPLLGFIAEHVSLVATFLVLLPCVLVSFLMAPVAEGRRPSWPRRRR